MSRIGWFSSTLRGIGNKGFTVAGLALAAALAGCGAVGTRDTPPEVVVKQRAQQRWDAMVAGDIDKVYGYMSPASREAISITQFRNSIRPGFWKKAEVTGVTCEADKSACDALLKITYGYKGSTVETPSRETWVLDKGEWWHVFKP